MDTAYDSRRIKMVSTIVSFSSGPHIPFWTFYIKVNNK